MPVTVPAFFLYVNPVVHSHCFQPGGSLHFNQKLQKKNINNNFKQ